MIESKSQLIRIRELCKLVCISRSNIYLLMSKNLFPKPIQIGPRSVAWVCADINKWVEGKTLGGQNV